MYHHHNYANAPPITHHIPDRHLNTPFHCREDTAENVQEIVRLPSGCESSFFNHCADAIPHPIRELRESILSPHSTSSRLR